MKKIWRKKTADSKGYEPNERVKNYAMRTPTKDTWETLWKMGAGRGSIDLEESAISPNLVFFFSYFQLI